MLQSSSFPARRDSESGYVLLAVVCMTVLLLISLAVAAPKVAQSIQREKDLETIHRGEQYRRAIQLYYRSLGNYPTSIDQLLNTNNVRFLRKRYTDPLTGKDDWKPVYYGQAHVRPLGFFGQPLSAVGVAGVASAVIGGASSGMYAIAPTSTDATTADGAAAGSDASGTTASTDSGFGSSSTDSGFGSSSAGSGAFSMGGQSGSSMGFGSGSATGTSSTGLGSTSGTSSSPFGSSSGTSATTFGGTGPIVGFTLPVDKPSMVVYMKQTRYNHWEFNYDPIVDQMQTVSLFGGGGAATDTTGIGTGVSGSTTGQQSPGIGSSTTPTSPDDSGSTPNSSPMDSNPQP